MTRIIDLIESDTKIVFEEASGEVDGKHVIGKIKGPFFVPDGVSRNNRKYPRDLWEKVCNNPTVRKRLENRLMFGTIGHEQKLGDSALLEGKVSHIITNLQIQNGIGVGEALIIDTPAGRVLNTLMRAGSKLYVSSRADGSFKGEDKGIPIVDPDTYQLEGFDVVVDPGFLQANPGLVESMNKILEATTKTNEGDFEMDAKLIENIAKENGSLKVELERAATEVETLKAQNTSLVSENNHFKSKVDKQRKAEILVGKYSNLGSPEELEKVLDISEAKISDYKKLGTVKELSKALDESEKLLDKYRELGSPKEINEALDKSMGVVQAYKELGSPAEITEAFTKMEKKVDSIRAEESKKKITALATELKVSEDKIKAVYGKLSEEEIRKLFTNVREGANSPYVKKNTPPTGKPNDKSPDLIRKSRGASLIEQFGGSSSPIKK